MTEPVVELYGRYSQAFDSGQAQVCAELFTPDAVFTNHGKPPVVGRAALQEFFGQAATRSVGVRHFVSNIVLDEVAPERVRGSAYVLLIRADSGGLQFVTMGTYADEFVYTDGRWLIGSRYFTPAGQPPADAGR
jgi:uncharacterized protein (TIGR02246 family)